MEPNCIVGPALAVLLRNTLAIALLSAAPARAFEGSVSVELMGGNRTLSGLLIGDWGILPERFYLVALYGVVRFAPSDDITAQPTHQFGLGFDWLISRNFLASLNVSGSPKATDTTRYSEFQAGTVSTTRRSAQAMLNLGYQSAGWSNVEWAVDLGAMGAVYEIHSVGYFTLPEGMILNRQSQAVLGLARFSLGGTLTLYDKTDISLRGSMVVYSSDPLTTGVLFPRLSLLAAAQTINWAALQAINSTTTFSVAPPLFDVRVSVARRFGARVKGKLSYTLMQYISEIGRSHALATQWRIKLKDWASLWAGATLQYDALNTQPSFWSGYGTLGAEFSTE